LTDEKAPPEEALWQAYKTLAIAPNDSSAKSLYREAAERVGQRDDTHRLDNAKIRQLEEALRKNPDDLQTLLQLAKLYKLEKDFVNMMKFFRRLQAIAPPDAYTQGQISSLVAPPAPTARTPAARTATVPSPGSSGRRSVVAPPPEPES